MGGHNTSQEQLLAELEISRRRVAELEKLEAKHKRVEKALRHSDETYLTLVEQGNDGFIIIQDGLIKFVNSKMTEITGFSMDESIGKSVVDFVSPKYRGLVVDMHKRRMSGEEAPSKYEIEILTKGGRKIPVEINASIIQYEGKLASMAIIRDITGHKRVEEQLKQAIAALERSNAELQQFAYVTSHDLQEPLRMVASFTQLLARRYKGKLDKDADEFITYAVDGANRMQRLIQDLLTYSRVGTRGKPLEPIDSEVVLDHALANLRMAVEESGAVVTHDPMPPVMGDDLQLVQLFQNLLSNAIKFHGEEPPRVHVSAEPKERENEWLFSVRDSGIGIAPKYFDRIFVIFQRLHSREEYSGTGTGLAICKSIVERHGGRIWVVSEPGKGSTFYFTLPMQ